MASCVPLVFAIFCATLWTFYAVLSPLQAREYGVKKMEEDPASSAIFPQPARVLA